jgi:hypothetical protein
VKMHLKARLIELTQKREQLENELKAGYDADKLRQINLLNHNIEVCEKRINGKFNDPRGALELKIEQ